MFSMFSHLKVGEVFPTRLLALACEVGAVKDPGGSEYFLRNVEKHSIFAFLTIPYHIFSFV